MSATPRNPEFDPEFNPAALIAVLESAVGRQHVMTPAAATRRYRKGFRFGEGRALAVVRPGTLLEQWKVLQACVDAGVIVIMQAANTGLTGGSTPDGNDYDREIVIISTSRMRKVYVINEGRQVLCLPGATLNQLEQLLKPMGREPHSVIGSSCIGASVFGGVCNNSGGALVRRGPAYTELALYAQVDSAGKLNLVNHLDMELGEAAEDILGRLDRGAFTQADVRKSTRVASDASYAAHVRQVDADTPARFNADPLRLHEASGSAGKLALFALRLDTFPVEQGAQVFYIGTNKAEELTDIRRAALQKFSQLPIAGEYMHRDAYDIAAKYGKDTFLLINWFGTDRLPFFFNLKNRFDTLIEQLGFLPAHLGDRLMQWLGSRFPRHLPARMNEYRDQFEHHLMLKVSAENVAETGQFLQQYFGTASGAYFLCTAEEGRKAFLHRFAAASAAVRYRDIHRNDVEDIVALDVALKRNDSQWCETLPPEIERAISYKLYYGHFLCHVFHQDYIVKKGHDCLELEHSMWAVLDERGAEYPAEHNVGHLYPAKPALKAFYRALDPCNCFNPGIGQSAKFENYREA